jgi:multisubunit Na+/H+ antiporter MnhG subunit
VIVGYVGTIIWGISLDNSTPDLIRLWILGIVVLILFPIIVMMIVIAVRRQKEIDEEDEDDLSQY